MEYVIAGLAIIIAIGAWLLFGVTNSRLEDAQREADELEGVIDVRRKAEAAKHSDPDAIKRVRDKYNK